MLYLGTFGFALVDMVTVGIAVATWMVFWRFKKVPEPLVILAAGVLGFVLKGLYSSS